MTIQFGAVTRLVQSNACPTVKEYNRRSEEIRREVRGNLEIMGPDPELAAAIKAELGEYPREAQAREIQEALERVDTYVQDLKQQHGEDYPVLLLKPSYPKDAAERLIVDGPDVADFQRELLERANSGKTPGVIDLTGTQSHSMGSALDTTSRNFSQKAVTLDLDA